MAQTTAVKRVPARSPARRKPARVLDYSTRVAWRQVRHWLEAQLALIAAQMVTLDEVMLPWLQIEAPGGPQALYARYKAQEAAVLEAGT